MQCRKISSAVLGLPRHVTDDFFYSHNIIYVLVLYVYLYVIVGCSLSLVLQALCTTATFYIGTVLVHCVIGIG